VREGGRKSFRKVSLPAPASTNTALSQKEERRKDTRKGEYQESKLL
jgi:hypothetical protein